MKKLFFAVLLACGLTVFAAPPPPYYNLSNVNMTGSNLIDSATITNSTINGLTPGSGNVSNTGTPLIHQFPVWTNATTIKGVAVTASKVVCTDSSAEPIACANLTDVVPLVSGGALGTPSSATLTNATGLPLAGIVQSNANTMLGNWSGSSANVAANAMPSCADSGGNHLNYVSGTGITCGTTSVNPGTVTSVSVSTANGFAGSVANSTSTPSITISTGVTGLLKGNGASVTAAVNSDLPVMSATVGGAVPTPPNNTTTFLRGDATFAAPPSTVSVGGSNAIQYANGTAFTGNQNFKYNGTDMTLNQSSGGYGGIKIYNNAINHYGSLVFDNVTNVGMGVTYDGTEIWYTDNNGIHLLSGNKLLMDNKGLVINTAPTISSGFGSSPSINSNNGTATFRVDVGTGGTASSGVIGLPTASTGWNCVVQEFNPNANALLSVTKVSASNTTSVTVENDLLSTGAATAWQASQLLLFLCAAY